MKRGGLKFRQCSLILRPVDDLEHHPAFEHFGLEVSGVMSPFGGLTNAESSFRFLPLQCIVGRQRAADGLVHQGEAVPGERLIIHRGSSPYEKAAAGPHSDGSSLSSRDRQKVRTTVRR